MSKTGLQPAFSSGILIMTCHKQGGFKTKSESLSLIDRLCTRVAFRLNRVFETGDGSTAISLRSVRAPAEASTTLISNNELSYRQALEVVSIPTLYARREAIGNSMFQDICNNNNHKLHSLLPPPYSGTLRTRKNRKFQVPRLTNRFRDSFIVSHCR